MHCFPFCNARRPLPLHTWQIPVPLQWEHFRYASSMAHPPNRLDEGTVTEIPELLLHFMSSVLAYRTLADFSLILLYIIVILTVVAVRIHLLRSFDAAI